MNDADLVLLGLQVSAAAFAATFLLMLMLGLLFTTFAAIRHLMGVS